MCTLSFSILSCIINLASIKFRYYLGDLSQKWNTIFKNSLSSLICLCCWLTHSQSWLFQTYWFMHFFLPPLSFTSLFYSLNKYVLSICQVPGATRYCEYNSDPQILLTPWFMALVCPRVTCRSMPGSLWIPASFCLAESTFSGLQSVFPEHGEDRRAKNEGPGSELNCCR